MLNLLLLIFINLAFVKLAYAIFTYVNIAYMWNLLVLILHCVKFAYVKFALYEIFALC